jgi:hypothetical protein
MGQNGIQRRHYLNLGSCHIHKVGLIRTQNRVTGQRRNQWKFTLVNPLALQPQIVSSVSHGILHHFLTAVLMGNPTGLAIVGQRTHTMLSLVIHKLLGVMKGCANARG